MYSELITASLLSETYLRLQRMKTSPKVLLAVTTVKGGSNDQKHNF